MSSALRAKIWTLTSHALPGQKSFWSLRCSSTVTAPIVPEILRATFGLSASPLKKMTPAEWDEVSGFTTKQRLD